MEFLLKFVLTVMAIIIIILVLLQRGKGGGLAGALGGAGGQSAFGTKAGDLFTKITIVVAAIWILFSVFAAIYAPYFGVQISTTQNANVQQNPVQVPETPGTGNATDSAAGKADKSGKSAPLGTTEKGSKGSGPLDKPAEKPTGPALTPPPAPTPSAPTTKVPAK